MLGKKITTYFRLNQEVYFGKGTKKVQQLCLFHPDQVCMKSDLYRSGKKYWTACSYSSVMAWYICRKQLFVLFQKARGVMDGWI